MKIHNKKEIAISTEAHGLNPVFSPPEPGHARIAFIEPVPRKSVLPEMRFDDNLLIIKATDVDYAQFGLFTQIGLSLGFSLDTFYKRFFLANNRSGAYPCAPMSLTDALAIVDFTEYAVKRGINHITISCEFGKSRSVSTANVMRAFLTGEDFPEKAVNQYVRDLVVKAVKKRIKK